MVSPLAYCLNENIYILVCWSKMSTGLTNVGALAVTAGIAQLGEQQTEVIRLLEVPCSIHGPGISFAVCFAFSMREINLHHSHSVQ